MFRNVSSCDNVSYYSPVDRCVRFVDPEEMRFLDEIYALNGSVDRLGKSFKALAKQAWIGLKKAEDARYF